MKCHKHYDNDAVAQCVDCGRSLCPMCSEKYTTPLCDNCALVRVSADKQMLIKNTIIMLVLFIVGYGFGNPQGNVFQKFMSAYAFAGIPWGWSALTAITPNMFLFMSFFGWIIYFTMKLILSIIIGMFVTPYQIFKIVKELKHSQSMESYIKS